MPGIISHLFRNSNPEIFQSRILHFYSSLSARPSNGYPAALGSEQEANMNRPIFEFDPGKSDSNKAKHGIDFVEAQALWKSPWLERPAKAAKEQRYLEIGTISGEHWTAIVTYVGAIIRIISVRKSNPDEIAEYARAKEKARPEKKS
jgi:uncharacterized DUF497 family protein